MVLPGRNMRERGRCLLNGSKNSHLKINQRTMQKNEFEKQVQQRMEELKIHPSDSIWPNIEAHLSKKKRRRLAWVFFPILLMCFCGGYWLINSVNESKQEQQDKLSEGFIKKDSLPKTKTSQQSSKDIAVLNRQKRILPQSFTT